MAKEILLFLIPLLLVLLIKFSKFYMSCTSVHRKVRILLKLILIILDYSLCFIALFFFCFLIIAVNHIAYINDVVLIPMLSGDNFFDRKDNILHTFGYKNLDLVLHVNESFISMDFKYTTT